MSKGVEFTVVGFNPKRGFNDARSGVQYVQLFWDGKCSGDSGGIDVHWESIVCRDLIRVRSKFNVEELAAGSKEHTAIVNEGLPDLHRYQTWDPSVCLRGSPCV
jgi:hypothetical protein